MRFCSGGRDPSSLPITAQHTHCYSSAASGLFTVPQRDEPGFSLQQPVTTPAPPYHGSKVCTRTFWCSPDVHRANNQQAQHHQCPSTTARWHMLSALPHPHVTCWIPKATYCSSPTVTTFQAKPVFEPFPFLLTQVKTLPFYPATCPPIYVSMGIHQR